MIQDQILNTYLTGLNRKIQDIQADIAKAKFADLYEVGILQGHVAGLEQARELLVQAIDQENI